VHLSEYQAKQLLTHHSIPIPQGFCASNHKEALQYGVEVGFPCMIKAQIPLIHRIKQGGICIAYNEVQFVDYVKELLFTIIAGYYVTHILIVRKILLTREIYIGIFLEGNL
jgi:succinyl-CoA synthetase beta subunit